MRPSTRAWQASRPQRSPLRASARARWRGANPEVTALLAQRGQIEHDLDGVKERKAALGQDAYYDELEGVLVKLALLQKQIDAKRAVQ